MIYFFFSETKLTEQRINPLEEKQQQQRNFLTLMFHSIGVKYLTKT